jgi:hypothetical protein
MARPGLSALMDDLKAAVLEAEQALDSAVGTDNAADGTPTPDPAAGPATRSPAAGGVLAFARRHPLAVLAGVAALGYLVGRLSRPADRP